MDQFPNIILTIICVIGLAVAVIIIISLGVMFVSFAFMVFDDSLFGGELKNRLKKFVKK